MSDALQTRRLAALLVLAAVVSFVGGMTWFHRSQAKKSQLRPMQLSGEWISANGSSSTAYFRKTIRLTSNVKNAWLVISACDAYEVSVNRNPLGRQYLWRPTRPFNNGMSEKGQRLTSDLSALALNFPREYQWDGHDAWRVPQFMDLTSSFRQGKNVICVELESRGAAKACFHGEIELWNGEKILLASDTSWRAEAVPPGVQYVDWTEPTYQDLDWRYATLAKPPDGQLWRTLDPAMYATPFRGKWLRHPGASANEPVWFEKTWSLESRPAEAWLRVVANRHYALFINDVRVGVASANGSEMDSGDWILGRQRALDPVTRPELLDPDEVGSMLAGDRFESPRHSDPRLENYAALPKQKESQHRKERATDRSEMPGEFDPIKSLAETRRTPRTDEGFPESVKPKALTRDHLKGGFLAYNVSRLLRAGRNKIAIRLCAPDTQRSSNWAAQVAFDGEAVAIDGNRTELESLAWNCRGESAEVAAAFVGERALIRMVGLPAMQYRGVALDPSRHAWPWYVGVTTVVVFGLLLIPLGGNSLSLRESRAYGEERVKRTSASQSESIRADASPSPSLRRWPSRRDGEDLVRFLFVTLLPATFLLMVALLLRMSFAERHEMLWFLQVSTWNLTILVAAVLSAMSGALCLIGHSRATESVFGHRLLSPLRGLVSFCRQLLGLTPQAICCRGSAAWTPEDPLAGASRWYDSTRHLVRSFTTQLIHLPETKFWKFAIIWMLILCGFLRAYKLDHQPLDDDEYASTQAILAIVETGVPGFVPEGVYYTRSPLFHYVTAGIAWLFGPHLWTLRLQSVGWSVATAWLAYLLGARLLKNPWVGFGAMTLLAIHPFQIYTGHIIRFYQMQQFFALLTVYLFCKGFVENQMNARSTQRFRYFTVAAFLASVFSQEISVVMGPPLAIGFFLFAKDLGWKANIKLAIVAAVALSMIVLDYAVFQTLCLTRVEGVSPNLEAAVKPHFWQPFNFLAIYIGYSRLHLLLSVFLFVGFPLAWRARNRNTLALHLILLFGVVLTNLLVTHVSIRYQYWLIPIWILLSLDAVRALLVWVVEWVYDREQHTNRYTIAICFSAAVIFGGVVLSWSPWRIPGSYDIKILGDSTGAMRFVRSQLRSGDKVAATEPHAHCGFLEAGQIDYDISVPLLYDFAMNSNGKLIDRNGGAEVVGTLDGLMAACRTNNRVWILLNREKFRTRGKNMRWEYPGARFETFVRKNCELKHRTYLWSVYLWDAKRGFYDPFRMHAG